MKRQEKIHNFLKNIDEFKKEHKLDLSSGEDLSIAVMNLISLEEHFFFTGAKTDNVKHFDLLVEVREIRKELLKKIVKDPEGEIWCVSKHLLAAAMRLMEVGNKYYNGDRKREAEDLFKKAYRLYSLFWSINLKTIDIGEIKRKKDDSKLMGRLEDLVQKLIDCCDE
jgi:hypothetical protein